MNGWLIALLLAGAALLALLTKPREKRRRWPKPGEGMRPPGAPRGGRRNRHRNGGDAEPSVEFVRLHGGVPAEEAHVLLGLLTSSGIKAGMRPGHASVGHPRGAPRAYDVYVDADRADDARALLGG